MADSTKAASQTAEESAAKSKIELKGYSVPIVLSKEKHVFSLDEESLESILLKEDVKDRNAVIISVAGAFRKGKSFLLDFFLRYLNYMYLVESDVKDYTSTEWIGDEHAPLNGFSWRGGSERETTGIIMWSELYCTTLPSGEKIAVIILDTQGTFDSESTVRDNATVFALSTMISSIQIYNLSQNIQEDDLQHLQLFTEYGRLALADTGKTPFQKLQFIVRDWSFPYEAAYGDAGGQILLDKRLKISDTQHPELQSLRKHIKSCFTDISCFLLPHPGLKVATNPNFKGQLTDIEQEFKIYLQQMVPKLLAPHNLVQKEISGQKIKVKDLLPYFKCYMDLFSGDELPEPKSMLVATAEANNLSAVAAAKESYHTAIEALCGGDKPFVNSARLEAEHLKFKDRAIQQFCSKRKMGGDEFSESYRLKLEKDIDDDYAQFKSLNVSKNIFKAFRTPVTIIIAVVLVYMLSGVFSLFGVYTLVNVANLVMVIGFVTLATWAYVRYSGELRDVGDNIDQAANFMWYNGAKPVYQMVVQKSLQHAAQNATASMLHRSNTHPQLNGQLINTNSSS